MTQQEIKALKDQVWEDYFNGDATEPCTIKRLDSALERLEKLEAAVAWHGFDELPEVVSLSDDNFHKRIELKRLSGDIVYNVPITLHGANYYKESDFTGWRYSVGDLL